MSERLTPERLAALERHHLEHCICCRLDGAPGLRCAGRGSLLAEVRASWAERNEARAVIQEERKTKRILQGQVAAAREEGRREAAADLAALEEFLGAAHVNDLWRCEGCRGVFRVRDQAANHQDHLPGAAWCDACAGSGNAIEEAEAEAAALREAFCTCRIVRLLHGPDATCKACSIAGADILARHRAEADRAVAEEREALRFFVLNANHPEWALHPVWEAFRGRVLEWAEGRDRGTDPAPPGPDLRGKAHVWPDVYTPCDKCGAIFETEEGRCPDCARAALGEVPDA